MGIGSTVAVVLYVGLSLLFGYVCYELGKKKAYNDIATNYIAIHKDTVIKPLVEQKKEVKNETRTKSKKVNRKTSKK